MSAYFDYENQNGQLNSSYDLSKESLHLLTKQLLSEHPTDVDSRYVCYRFAGDDKFSNIGRSVERTVFEDAFGNDAEQMVKEYGSYEQSSIFFLSIDREQALPSGTLRIIGNSEHGFKTLNDLEHSSLELDYNQVAEYYQINDPDTVWDIGTVAVLPEYRSAEGAVSVQLYRAMYVSAMQNKIQHFVSVIDQKPLHKLVDYLGIPFESLMGSEPFEYLGSESSQAVYGFVPDFYRKMSKKLWTPKGMLARKALKKLVKGTEDFTLLFDDDSYKK